MTMVLFAQLTEMEQISVIMEHGTLISQHLRNEERVFLYSIDNFFISASYSLLSDRLMEVGSYLELGQMIRAERIFAGSKNPAERVLTAPSRM